MRPLGTVVAVKLRCGSLRLHEEQKIEDFSTIISFILEFCQANALFWIFPLYLGENWRKKTNKSFKVFANKTKIQSAGKSYKIEYIKELADMTVKIEVM